MVVLNRGYSYGASPAILKSRASERRDTYKAIKANSFNEKQKEPELTFGSFLNAIFTNDSYYEIASDLTSTEA